MLLRERCSDYLFFEYSYLNRMFRNRLLLDNIPKELIAATWEDTNISRFIAASPDTPTHPAKSRTLSLFHSSRLQIHRPVCIRRKSLF